jgi:hypothetical protein
MSKHAIFVCLHARGVCLQIGDAPPARGGYGS